MWEIVAIFAKITNTMEDNRPIIVTVSVLKIVESELMRCFGYSHNDFVEELSQLFFEKYVEVENGKVVYPADYDNYCRSQAEYSWAKGDGELQLLIPDTSNTDVLDFLNSNFCRTEHNSLIMLTLFVLAMVHYRNNRTSQTDYDCERDDFYRYALAIRPDMLKLYIALHSKRNLKKNKPVRISLKENPPILLENEDYWFERMLERYLDKYLGVKDLEEAETELKDLYGKKKGCRFENKEASEFMWGIYHLLEYSDNKKLCTMDKKSVPRPVVRFIYSYLELIGIVAVPQKSTQEDEIDIMRSQLTYLLKRYKDVNELKNDKIYKCSPNNCGFNKSVTGYY